MRSRFLRPLQFQCRTRFTTCVTIARRMRWGGHGALITMTIQLTAVVEAISCQHMNYVVGPTACSLLLFDSPVKFAV